MAITDKEKGVWGLDQVYNKINQGSIWQYNGVLGLWAVGGNNARGQLGQNDTVSRSSPIQVGSDSTWDKVAGKFSVMDPNDYSVAAIKTDGTLWTWGDNDNGLLGLNQGGNPANRSSPTQVGTDTTWSTITGSCSYGGFMATQAI